MVAVSACADILDLPDDPTLAAQGPWRCLQTPPEPEGTGQEMAIVRVQACNFVSTNCSAPVTDLTASLCDKKDVNCANPIRSGIRDTGGVLTFEVSTGGALGVGFDGYLQVKAPPALCTNEAIFGPGAAALCALSPSCDPQSPDDKCMIPSFAPALLFFNPAIRSDVTRPLLLQLVPTGAFPLLAEAAGAALDPTSGNVFITALDCDGKPASGVTLNMSEDLPGRVTPLYLVDGVISDTVLQTDSSGTAGFLGVPAGFAEIVGYTADGSRIRIGQIGVQTAPSTITYSALPPVH
jgi:hypothetical protein